MRTGKGWRLAEAARNMTARRHRRFSYGDWLCFCFIAGVTYSRFLVYARSHSRNGGCLEFRERRFCRDQGL